MLIAEKLLDKKILLFLIIFSLFLNFWLAMVKEFDPDELEHFHSSWYVAHGYLPYLDFFQHHQPLLWYCFSPFFIIFGDKISLLFLARFFAWLCLLGAVWLTYRIGEKIFGAKTGLLGIMILSTTLIFLEKIIEFRPDSFQVFFTLLSFYFLVLFFSRYRPKKIFLVLSAVTLAICFLFSLKTIFILPAFLILILLKSPPENSLKSLFVFGLIFLSVVLFVLLVIFPFDFSFFKEYFFFNFTLNKISRPNQINIFTYLNRSLIQNAFFWLLGAVSFFCGLRFFKKNNYFIMALPIFFLFVSLLMAPAPFRQYYLSLIPFLSLLIAQFLIQEKRSAKLLVAGLTIFFIICQIIIPFVFLSKRAYAWVSPSLQKRQINRMEYVLKNATVNDLVHDGNLHFNVFRRDLAYVWFSWDAYLPVLKRVRPDKTSQDIYQLIIDKKPKIISRAGLNNEKLKQLEQFYYFSSESSERGFYLRKK